MVVSPVRKLWHPKCRAAMDDEQAVSKLILGPLKSKNHDILLDIMADPVPVPWYRGRSSGSEPNISL